MDGLMITQQFTFVCSAKEVFYQEQNFDAVPFFL